MKQIRLLYIILYLLLCVSCVEKFDIEIDGHADLIVIDAMITDYDSVQYVYIRREKESLGYRYEPYYPPFDESSVYIEDDKGWRAEFKNQDRGREFALTGHRFEPGRTYTITVSVDDREFKATEKMIPLPDIDGLKFYAKDTKEDDVVYQPILYFKDNQPDVDNYYLFDKYCERNSNASRFVSIQRLSDQGLRADLDGIVLELGLGAEWFLDSDDQMGDSYYYSFMTISQSNYNYFGIMADQINNDGGIYKPTPSSPVTNFSGADVQGQFIAASKTEFNGFITEDIIVER
ncbi:MAG: DUF4249 family protein [Marinilabiliaceae bacterium]|nr:DUF4249 family protein [Marinilabiliaceae bacterium]